jgi:hypothetical protein
MKRPLHLCEVLEEEDRSLYGVEWHFTAADIIDANKLARAAGQVFADLAAVSAVLAKASVSARVDLQHERAQIATELNRLVDQPTPISVEHPGLLANNPVAAQRAIADYQETPQAQNRAVLDIAFADAVRSARDFGWRYDREQIRDLNGFVSRWRDVLGDPPPEVEYHQSFDPDLVRDKVAAALSALVTGSAVLDSRAITGAVSARTRKLLDDARENHPSWRDREWLNRLVLDDIFSEHVQRGEDARLAKCYEVIHHRKAAHEQPSSALCFSGGGIRSATFGLGILQALARRNLLDKFDYLSTVSGGGYIGGWLSSWIRRHPHGVRGVSQDLSSIPDDKLAPDPEPVRHLREFSNYLTPRLGVFSGDTLSVAAIYIRNLILDWFVLIPVLLAAVTLPRIVDATYYAELILPTETLHRWSRLLRENWLDYGADKPLYHPMRWISAAGNFDLMLFWTVETHTAAWTATVLLVIASIYLGKRRPKGSRDNRTPAEAQRDYFLFCLLPLIGASVAITAAWAQHTMTWYLLGTFVLLPLIAGAVYLRDYLNVAATDRGSFFARMRQVEQLRSSGLEAFADKWKAIVEFFASVLAAGVSAGAIWYLATRVFADPNQRPTIDTFPSPILSMLETRPIAALYVCFAVPALLAVLFLSATMFVGAASAVNEDYEREWWARSSGYVVGAIAVWIIATVTVIFGPVVICFAPKIIASVGGVTGLVSVLIARSAKTSAKGRGDSLVAKIAAAIAAPVFILFVLASLSLLTTRVLARKPLITSNAATLMAATHWTSSQTQKINQLALLQVRDAEHAAALIGNPAQRPMPMLHTTPLEVTTATEKRPMFDPERYDGWVHMVVFHDSPLLPMVAFALVSLAVAFGAAYFVNVNKFSMHSMYRNRLIRAYLGASRGRRHPDPITGFDPRDDVAMHMLRPELLWATSFSDVGRFLDKLQNPPDGDELSASLASQLRRLSDKPERLLPTHDGAKGRSDKGNSTEEARRSELFQLLNWVLVNCDIEHLGVRERSGRVIDNLRRHLSDIKDSFFSHPPDAQAPSTAGAQNPSRARFVPRTEQERLRYNRTVLDAHYPEEIYPFEGPTLHRADIRKVRTFVQHFGTVDEIRRYDARPPHRRSETRKGKTAAEHVVSADDTSPFEITGETIAIRNSATEIDPEASFDEKLLHALTPEARAALARCSVGNPDLQRELDVVIADLNRILTTYDLRSVTPFDRGQTSVTPFDRGQTSASGASLQANRRILDEKFSDAIHPLTTPRPMHLVNVALNLVGGENLAWQERKAESFTFSPMHSGSFRLGYRDSSQYGGRAGVSLGTAVTISGAAVSPNMGYHSSAALAFLMTLFNVRLGWWLGNPGPFGSRTWDQDGPQPALQPLLAEATGNTNDTFKYVYLSDGGHFENLGLYEMVLRRRHFIVVSDAASDPDFHFEDLGNAIRKIRMDLGVPIEFDKMCVYPRSQDVPGKYCAMAKIRYSAVDRNGQDGELLYIKPAFYMHEPKDVFNYAASSPEFPHESTGDQWFSESQFESYRILGSYALDQISLGKYGVTNDTDRAIAANWTPATMDEFFDRARDYLHKAKEERRKFGGDGARASA